MTIPTDLKQSADEALAGYCQRRAPSHGRDQVQLLHQWHGTKVTLVERRPHWKHPEIWGDSPVAQFRFEPGEGAWSLYWLDRHQRWHPYEGHPRAKNIGRLLSELDRDPAGIFWG